MQIPTVTITAEDVTDLLAISESHFVDLKGFQITPAKLTKTISAFANTSGGEIYVGIDEFEGADGKERAWLGFSDEEAANHFFQVVDQIDPLGSNFAIEFLRADGNNGLVLHITIFKSQSVIFATDGKAYVRRSAQSLPVAGEEALERLKYDKGVKSFEDELVDIPAEDITNSEVIIDFLLETVPTGEPDAWLKKQRVLIGDRPTVAGTLLYSDNPQAALPKRSAVKICGIKRKGKRNAIF